jgi:hypothetical protein
MDNDYQEKEDEEAERRRIVSLAEAAFYNFFSFTDEASGV